MQAYLLISDRTKLLVLLAIQAVMIVGYKLFDFEWVLYPCLILGIFTYVYAYSIQCPLCGRRQVFRGISAFDIRLPDENCYFCKSLIHPK
jgi:hypothetical protein